VNSSADGPWRMEIGELSWRAIQNGSDVQSRTVRVCNDEQISENSF